METKDSPPTNISIKAEQLCKYYGEFAAIDQVSFSVRQGTVVAFLGPNGAGKSTVMKILTGFLSPSRGKAQVAGFNPSDPTQRIELAKKLGYLPENGPLYGDMTPAETLQFFGQVRGLGGDLLAQAIHRVSKQCDITSVLGKPVSKLSKGFRQRVGMAQALLHNPEVLILDEPTSGLDPLQIREVRQLIRELGKTKTVLLSTHILQEVDAVADDVIVIRAGRIVFTGSKMELRQESNIERRFYELMDKKEAA